MKKLLRNLLFPTLLASTFCVYAPIILAVPIISTIKYMEGYLEIQNYVDDSDFRQQRHKIFHNSAGTEGYDDNFDSIYGNPQFPPSGKKTKIVSIIPGYELTEDGRPLSSFTPVDLELAIHTLWGGSLSFPNLKNCLKCKIDVTQNFGAKPITLWRRFPDNPEALQFLADIREAIAKQGETGIVPLPNLNGEYGSQVPYGFYQVRFDVYPGNLNFSLDSDGKILDGIVDMKDLAILGNDWGKQGQPLEFVGDITGPQGLPDGKVDYQDLELLTRYWLKDIRDIMPSP
jgi:hypothetical protein